MGSGARVSDIKALSDFRPAIVRFGEDVQRALMGPGSTAERLLIRLERERLPYWKREIRVRSEAAVVANTKLVQQTTSENPRPSVDARKAYERAKQRVSEAEAKCEQTHRVILKLKKEIDVYRGAIQPMATIARSEMQAAVGRLDAHIKTLDEYTRMNRTETRNEGLGENPDSQPSEGSEPGEAPEAGAK